MKTGDPLSCGIAFTHAYFSTNCCRLQNGSPYFTIWRYRN